MPQEWVEYERVSGRFHAESGKGTQRKRDDDGRSLGDGESVWFADDEQPYPHHRSTNPWTPPSESRCGLGFAAMQLAQSVRCHVRHAVRSSGLVRNQPRTADPETVRSPSLSIIVRGVGIEINPGCGKRHLMRWGGADQLVGKWVRALGLPPS